MGRLIGIPGRRAHDFELDHDDLAAIGVFDRGDRLMDPDWAPDWDT